MTRDDYIRAASDALSRAVDNSNQAYVDRQLIKAMEYAAAVLSPETKLELSSVSIQTIYNLTKNPVPGITVKGIEEVISVLYLSGCLRRHLDTYEWIGGSA